MKLYWNNTPEYKRILEILEDYWLSEPEEQEVRVEMYFRKKDGQTQEKYIWWINREGRRKE